MLTEKTLCFFRLISARDKADGKIYKHADSNRQNSLQPCTNQLEKSTLNELSSSLGCMGNPIKPRFDALRRQIRLHLYPGIGKAQNLVSGVQNISPYPSFRKRVHFKTLYIFQFYLYSKAIFMLCVHCITSQQYPFIRTLNPCMRFESFAYSRIV